MIAQKAVRIAKRDIENEGLTIDKVVNTKRHTRIYCHHPKLGHRGIITVHLGSKPNPRLEASIRSECRSIARGLYQDIRL